MPDEIFQFLNREVKVSHGTYERLLAYHDLLLKWQSKINLIGPDTIPELWTRHFLDSLQLMNHIPDLSKTMVDLGSGAGFPGMALAIMGASDIHLIESDSKKVTFLKEVARVTKTKISIHHCRIEDRPVDRGDVIISRACSSLDKLLAYSLLYISHGTICLFHKGKNYSKEISDANEHWLFDHTIFPSITDTQGIILKLINVRKRGYDRSEQQP